MIKLGQGRGVPPVFLNKAQGRTDETDETPRDRHGRVIGDATIRSAEQLAFLIELAPAFEALTKIARRVFIDRNAEGLRDEKPAIRAKTRASVRPVLRKALAHAALARTAILRADRPTFDAQLSCARRLLDRADVLFSQPAKDIVTQGREGQVRKAKLPRTAVLVDGERVKKNDLVATALNEAGIGATTPEVWPHLLSVLERQGMNPQETGAKDTRRITAWDDDGKEVEFSVKGVQAGLRKMRDRPVKKGRPKD